MSRHSKAPGRWIVHRADRVNVLRARSAPAIFFSPFIFGFPRGYEFVWAALIFALIGDINYILHLHIHRPFSRSPGLNLLLDLSMGAVTGMTSSNWRIQHLYGHHRGVDLPYRAERIWELERYSPLRVISFIVCSICQTFYVPFVESFRKGILRNIETPISYRWAFCEQALLIALIAVLAVWQPSMVFGYLLPWYVLTYCISRYVDYLNHYGCDERSDNQFERANNSLCRWFNYSTHHFGYHTAHHVRPGAHWTELPDVHRAIADRIPARCLKPFSWSFLLMPYHFYLSRSGRM